MAAAIPTTSIAQPLTNLYIFGDSSSDPGAAGPDQRPTNLGNMWGEALGKSLSLSSAFARKITLDGNLEVIASTPAGGTNYAINGATTVTYNPLRTFKSEVDSFVEDRGRFKPNDLVFTWFTRNDITEPFFLNLAPYDQQAYETAYLQQIMRLKSLGARNIVAVGAEITLLPDQLLLDGGIAQGDLDTLRTLTETTEASIWPKLQASGVYLIDIEKFTADIAANPAKYGFTHAKDSFMGRGEASITPYQQRPNDGNVFTTDGHYTSQMQSVLADYFLAQIRARDQFTGALLQTGDAFRNLGGDPFSSARDAMQAGQFHVYGGPGITTTRHESSGGADVATRATDFSSFIGADYLFTPQTLAGARISFSTGTSDYSGNTGSIQRNLALLTLYGSHQLTQQWRVEAIGSLGIADLPSIKRSATLGDTARATAEGSTTGSYLSAKIRTEYASDWGSLRYAIGASLAVDNTGLRGFVEKNNPISLAYGDSRVTSVLGGVDLRIEGSDPTAAFRPFLDLSYTHDFAGEDVNVKVGPRKDMLVDYVTERTARNRAGIGIGASYTFGSGWVLTSSANWTGTLDKEARSNSFGSRLAVSKKF